MSPLEQAAQVYEQERCARSFAEDLELHLAYGYVLATPDAFIMARPVWRDAPYADITNPAHQFARVDAWLVYLAGGALEQFQRLAPFSLPYLGWERQNRLRFYPWNRVWRKLKYDRIPIRTTVHALLQGRERAQTATAATASGAVCCRLEC